MDNESTGCIPFHSSVSPHVFPRVSPIPTGPRTMGGWVLLGVGTPTLPQLPLRDASPVVPAFTFAPPSLPPIPSGSAWLERPWWAEDQARDLSRLLGAQEGRGKLATLPFDSLPSQWSPNFLLQAWDPFPSPSRPSGVPVRSRLHLSSPLTPPPTPHILPGCWGLLPSP